jgi:ABC-type Fe3+/spermidine/putrescine transport system ATPase subunit
VLQIQHLNKSFSTSAGNRVLDDFDLDVKPGEFVSLIGPSGCG